MYELIYTTSRDITNLIAFVAIHHSAKCQQPSHADTFSVSASSFWASSLVPQLLQSGFPATSHPHSSPCPSPRHNHPFSQPPHFHLFRTQFPDLHPHLTPSPPPSSSQPQSHPATQNTHISPPTASPQSPPQLPLPDTPHP